MSTKITVNIETGSSLDSLSVELHGDEHGDNPAFTAQQVDTILGHIGTRFRGMASAYFGEQR